MNHNKLILSLIIGIFFSGLALLVTFKNIPLKDFIIYLKSVNYWWAIPSLCIGMGSFLLRVVRWQLILKPVKKATFLSSFHPLMIGFMINSVLPGRVGEIARPAIFSRKEGVPFSKVLATVGAERVFDVMTLLFLSVIMLSVVEINSALDLTFGGYHLNRESFETIWIATVKICVILFFFIVIIGIKKTRTIIKQIILQIPGMIFFIAPSKRESLRSGIFKKITMFLDNLASGLEIIKKPSDIFWCLLLSFMVWITSALAFFVMAFGCPGINISFLEMCAVLVIICFFIALPSVPGYWGLFEAGGVFGLMIFGVSSTEGAGFILANHVIQMLPTIIIGIISSTLLGVNFANAYSNGSEKKKVVESLEADQVR